MEDQRIVLLRDTKISKAINTMSIPAIIGMLVMAIYNVVDTMFVAWLGTSATSATQVVLPIMMLTSAFGLAFGIGGGSYVSRLLGQNDMKKAQITTSVSFFTAVGAGLVFVIVSLLNLENLLYLFGANDSIIETSKNYAFFIIIGSVFTMGNMTMNNILRSEGSSKLSMLGMAAGSVLNVALDPLFIFTFGWGVSGAGFATALSQGFSFLILLSHYLMKRSVLSIKLSNFKPSLAMYTEIFKVGIPTFLRQTLFSITIGFLNNRAFLYGGNDLLAAVGIVFRIGMIPTYILFGIGQGFQPVVGYNFGAKNKKRILDALKYTLSISLILAFISSLFLIFGGEIFMHIFKASPSVTAYGIRGLKYFAGSILLLAVTNCISIFYQAIGKGIESLILSISRQGIFYLPAIFIAPLFFDADGILSSQLIADAFTFIVTAFVFIPFLLSHKLDKELDAS